MEVYLGHVGGDCSFGSKGAMHPWELVETKYIDNHHSRPIFSQRGEVYSALKRKTVLTTRRALCVLECQLLGSNGRYEDCQQVEMPDSMTEEIEIRITSNAHVNPRPSRFGPSNGIQGPESSSMINIAKTTYV